MKITTYPRPSLYGRIHPLYAKKGGGAVLRNERHKWRHLSGFGFNFRHRHILVELRRHR